MIVEKMFEELSFDVFDMKEMKVMVDVEYVKYCFEVVVED